MIKLYHETAQLYTARLAVFNGFLDINNLVVSYEFST